MYVNVLMIFKKNKAPNTLIIKPRLAVSPARRGLLPGGFAS
jgi:hypothetical protein